MIFPIAIEPGSETTSWGVVVPDLPGCFSAGDTAEEAFTNAAEAIEAHLELMVEDGEAVPLPRPLAHWQTDPQFSGWLWSMVPIDTSRYEGKAEKINITLPRNLLVRVDAYARARGETRSGFLARLAREALARAAG